MAGSINHASSCLHPNPENALEGLFITDSAFAMHHAIRVALSEYLHHTTELPGVIHSVLSFLNIQAGRSHGQDVENLFKKDSFITLKDIKKIRARHGGAFYTYVKNIVLSPEFPGRVRSFVSTPILS